MENISLVWIMLYIFIAISTIPIVRLLGPVAIREYGLESEYDDITGKSNVTYRILSPVICSLFLILICETFLSPSDIPIPAHRWIPSLLYWVILGTAKFLTKNNSITHVAYFIEAACSVLLAFLLEHFVIEGYYSLGIGILDQSNFAFQMEMAIFYVVVQMVVTLITRHRYRIDTMLNRENCSNIVVGDQSTEDTSQRTYHGTAVDTSEKNLFGYERKFGDLLPARYSQDLLLRTVFFTIMAIEDCNRPESWRFIERVACSLGIAKTTGIMQQKSKDPLSDEESVLLAVEYIEKMWDRYLAVYAKSAECCSEVHMLFSHGWYEYEYSFLADTLGSTFGSFYGDYCGSRLHDANLVFQQVRQFEERNRYNLLPKTIIASANIFDIETKWLSSLPATWSDTYTIQCVDRMDVLPHAAPLSNHYELLREKVLVSDVTHCCDALKEQGYSVERVTFAEGVVAIIGFTGAKKPTSSPVENWFIYQ